MEWSVMEIITCLNKVDELYVDPMPNYLILFIYLYARWKLVWSKVITSVGCSNLVKSYSDAINTTFPVS